MSRSVLVAGATGGLGSTIAGILAERGDTLTLVARDAARLDALTIDGQLVALDLRDPACEQAIAAAAGDGSIDVVVDAVGVVAFGTVDELDVDTMEELFLTEVRVLDARPPHTETGLATHPIAGTAPKMPTGLDPAHVAQVICDAIDADTTDLPSAAFG